MEDFLKRPLAIGDHVVLIMPRYRQLTLARISKFTAKKVQVILREKRWNGEDGTLLQDPEQLVRVEGPDLTVYLLKK